MKIEVSAGRMNRGRTWFYRVGDKLGATVGYSYIASNDGGAFSRNYRRSPVRVYVVCWDDAEQRAGYSDSRVELDEGARTAAEAEKLARAAIRELGYRDIARAACKRLASAPEPAA